MSTSDEHPEVPDTAMATGNDEGEPGEQRDPIPLSPDEQRLLEELEHPTDAPATPAVEDSPEAATAVDDDAPMAVGGDGGDGEYRDDGLTPKFTDR